MNALGSKRWRARLVFGVAGMLAMAWAPRRAVAAFNLFQLTHTSEACGNQEPTLSADGGRVAFTSTCKSLGVNPDGNREVYSLDIDSQQLVQLTFTTGCSNEVPAISADGSRVVFLSTCNLAGMPVNLFGGDIFAIDVATRTVTQVTRTNPPCNNDAPPAINGDGTRIAFQSTCNLTGSNADLNPEILHLDFVTEVLTPITATSGCANRSPSLDEGGTHVAFVSEGCNLSGQETEGSAKIYRFDLTTSAFEPVTSAAGCPSDAPVIDAAGTRIAFQSLCDLVGRNNDGNLEVFLADSESATIQQLTDTTGAGLNRQPAISSNGDRVALVADVDLGAQIYAVDVEGGQIRAVTGGSGCSSTEAALDTNGSRIVFQSSCNLSGADSSGNDELFLAVETEDLPTPTATATGTPLPEPTPTPGGCPGDCNGDRAATVDEILTLVNLALGTITSPCPAADSNQDGTVAVDDIIRAVNAALGGCA